MFYTGCHWYTITLPIYADLGQTNSKKIKNFKHSTGGVTLSNIMNDKKKETLHVNMAHRGTYESTSLNYKHDPPNFQEITQCKKQFIRCLTSQILYTQFTTSFDANHIYQEIIQNYIFFG